MAEQIRDTEAIQTPLQKTEKKKIAFYTLGCKLNQYETDSLATQFQSSGYEIVPFEEKAHAYVINTCTVTNKADRKSRNIINRAKRLVKTADLNLEDLTGDKSGTVVVTGCFVNSHIDSLESDGRTFIVPNERKNQIVEMLDAHFKGELHHPNSGLHGGITGDLVGNIQGGDPFAFPPSQQIFHTRGMLKIQDGCDNFCTFCIIPFVRGRAISRSPKDIIANMKELLAQGYKEVVLTGVNMSRYQYEDVDFTQLVSLMLEQEGEYRLRISSIEPDQISDRFLQLLSHPKMSPHLHLCLQSGSEKTLLAMRRQYTYRQYRQIIDTIRETNPLFNITTDIIIGFPGETDQTFEESLTAAQDIGFGHIHCFPYSVRKGTRAERMADHVPEKTKQQRSGQLLVLSEQLKRKYRTSLIGQEEVMLVESVEEAGSKLRLKGLGKYYVPIEVFVPNTRIKESFHNQFIPVTITGLDDSKDPILRGEIQWSAT